MIHYVSFSIGGGGVFSMASIQPGLCTVQQHVLSSSHRCVVQCASNRGKSSSILVVMTDLFRTEEFFVSYLSLEEMVVAQHPKFAQWTLLIQIRTNLLKKNMVNFWKGVDYDHRHHRYSTSRVLTTRV